MAHPLDGVREKLARADRHLDEIKAAIEREMLGFESLALRATREEYERWVRARHTPCPDNFPCRWMRSYGGSGQAPRECGISTEVEVEWRTQASLAALGLQGAATPDFPHDRRGNVYVTERDSQGRRTYCIQLDPGTEDVWTHSGLAPAGWNPPSN